MAQETLNRIRQTELEAKKIVQDAQTTGAELLGKAQEDALKYREELIAKYRAQAQAALKNTEKDLEPSLEKASVRAKAVIEQFSRTLDSKKEAAIALVIDSLI